MFINNKEGWYAIFVATNQEEKIKKRLEMELGDDLQFIIPKRELKERKNGRWHSVKRNLFPGYILIKGIFTMELYYNLKKFPYMIRLLSRENELLKIQEKELQLLNMLIDNKENTIGFSTIYKENDKIKVIDGPLVGLEGHIKHINSRKGRAKVQLSFLNEEKIVELGIVVLDKI